MDGSTDFPITFPTQRFYAKEWPEPSDDCRRDAADYRCFTGYWEKVD
jgi:hypothetical protein